MSKTILYLAKEPDRGVIGDLKSLENHDITVGACNPGYVDYYKLLGYNVITNNDLFSGIDMKFNNVIGNPPYNNQLYRKFLESISSHLDADSTFDLLFPVYIYTRLKCVKVFKTELKLEYVDMTVGHHFKSSVSGAWVVRIRGRLGVTDTFDLTYPDGNVTHNCTLDDVNPSSAIFIEDMVKRDLPPLTDTDRLIANKILTSSIELTPHKTLPITDKYICYMSPVIRRMTQKDNDEYPGILHLRTMTKYDKDTVNGYYIETQTQEEADRLAHLYGRSKLFVYLFYLTASDSIYADTFIKRLPHPDHIPSLNDEEMKRVDKVLSIV